MPRPHSKPRNIVGVRLNSHGGIVVDMPTLFATLGVADTPDNRIHLLRYLTSATNQKLSLPTIMAHLQTRILWQQPVQPLL